MITNTFTVSLPSSFLRCRGIDPDDCVFFDIETTGFRPGTSQLYLIGAAVSDPKSGLGSWTITQWMASQPGEEEALLNAFRDFLDPSRTLVHFNGKKFDLPYLEEKYALHQIPSPFSHMKGVDLYRDFRPLKSFLKLERMNQKSLEDFLGVNREDLFDGGQLIPVYRQFIRSGSQELLAPLLLHNREDISGMIRLTALYSYWKLFEDAGMDPPFPGRRIQGELLTHQDGAREVLLTLPLESPVSVPVSHMSPLGYFSLGGDQAKWLIPVREGSLRYFFPDYKNYYYLPNEDQAMHKSVAVYVDKQFRQPATRENCYIKTSGLFLPQPEELFSPALRENCQEKQLWFSLTEDFLQDQGKLAQYLASLLGTLR